MKKCNRCKIEKEDSEFNKNQNMCKECFSEYNKQWKLNHPNYHHEQYLKAKKQDGYLEKMNDYQKMYNTRRRNKDPFFKLVMNIRNLVGAYTKRLTGEKMDKNIEEILGCSFEEFKVYLESKFEPWMNWGNYGGRMEKDQSYEVSWELDHIVPIRFANTKEAVYQLNHHTNLRPLDAAINRRRKRNK